MRQIYNMAILYAYLLQLSGPLTQAFGHVGKPLFEGSDPSQDAKFIINDNSKNNWSPQMLELLPSNWETLAESIRLLI